MHTHTRVPHPHSVCLAQSHRVGQLDLDLSAMERSEHPDYLQQSIIQPGERERETHTLKY